MATMTEKTTAPKTGGWTIPGILAILTGIVSLTIFLTGKTNLPAILGISEKAPTATFAADMLPTATLESPAAASQAAATTTSAPDVTRGPVANGMTARPPADSDLEQLASIWSLTDFREQTAPDYFHYSVSVKKDSTWLWDCNFCASDQAFLDYAGAIQLEFRIDGMPLREDLLRIYDRPGIAGWICRIWSTVLTDWPPDRSVNLEVVYSYGKPVSDGKTEFPAGEYHQQIVVFVER
jgi:hypothetical protein